MENNWKPLDKEPLQDTADFEDMLVFSAPTDRQEETQKTEWKASVIAEEPSHAEVPMDTAAAVMEEPPVPEAKKDVVPVMKLGKIKIRIPLLCNLLLAGAAVMSVFIRIRTLVWLLAVAGVVLFCMMSFKKYRKQILGQRILCLVITAALVLFAAIGIDILRGDIDVEILGQKLRYPTKAFTTEERLQRMSHDGVSLDMVLYYDKEGGSFYHTTDRCPSISEEFLPLKGKIIYEDLSKKKFQLLDRCTTCSAPIKPHTH